MCQNMRHTDGQTWRIYKSYVLLKPIRKTKRGSPLDEASSSRSEPRPDFSPDPTSASARIYRSVGIRSSGLSRDTLPSSRSIDIFPSDSRPFVSGRRSCDIFSPAIRSCVLSPGNRSWLILSPDNRSIDTLSLGKRSDDRRSASRSDDSPPDSLSSDKRSLADDDRSDAVRSVDVRSVDILSTGRSTCIRSLEVRSVGIRSLTIRSEGILS